jgi:hypothetical protein
MSHLFLSRNLKWPQAAFSLYSLFVGASVTGLATAYGDLMQAAGAADRVFSLTHKADGGGSGGMELARAGPIGLQPTNATGGVPRFQFVPPWVLSCLSSCFG